MAQYVCAGDPAECLRFGLRLGAWRLNQDGGQLAAVFAQLRQVRALLLQGIGHECDPRAAKTPPRGLFLASWFGPALAALDLFPIQANFSLFFAFFPYSLHRLISLGRFQRHL